MIVLRMLMPIMSSDAIETVLGAVIARANTTGALSWRNYRFALTIVRISVHIITVTPSPLQVITHLSWVYNQLLQYLRVIDFGYLRSILGMGCQTWEIPRFMIIRCAYNGTDRVLDDWIYFKFRWLIQTYTYYLSWHIISLIYPRGAIGPLSF